MKKVLFLLFTVVACSFAFKGNAQAYKFGHLNTTDLLMAMPERDSMNKKLEVYAKDMEEAYSDMLVEYNKKMEDFQKNQDKWSEAIKQVKQKDLVDIQRRLQEQQQSFQQGLQEQQQKLFAPIEEKVRVAISKVAKANGMIYVFEIAGNNLLYFNDAQSTDIMPLVKKELNLK